MQQTSVQKQKKSKKIGGFSMFKKMKHMKNEKGLTLIELLAVIVILAIIAAIAIPAIGNIINNQRDKAILSDISGAVSAAKIAYAEGTCSAGASLTPAVAAKEACNLGDIAFSSGKISTIIVDFSSNSGDPSITVALDSTKGDFKGKKAGTYDTLVASAFSESALNSAMGN